MIRATLIRSIRASKPVSRLISTSVPKNTIGALQEFTEHSMVADGQWAGKIVGVI
jgi:hypothetical protein